MGLVLTQCLLILGYCVDCVYFPQNFSVVSKWPINQFKNCKAYCIQFYSGAPQRNFYNETSQNCEPARLCVWSGTYSDYNTNACYTNNTMTQLAESYIPANLASSYSFGNPKMLMVCVNGKYNLMTPGKPA
jgi:hypothetical protein